MKSWIAKYGEVKLFVLCEQDRLDEEELDIIHKRLHEHEKESEKN